MEMKMPDYYDKEWEDAWLADEEPIYFKCEMLHGGYCIKLYKPSLMKLVLKRGGYISAEPMEKINA